MTWLWSDSKHGPMRRVTTRLKDSSSSLRQPQFGKLVYCPLRAGVGPIISSTEKHPRWTRVCHQATSFLERIVHAQCLVDDILSLSIHVHTAATRRVRIPIPTSLKGMKSALLKAERFLRTNCIFSGITPKSHFSWSKSARSAFAMIGTACAKGQLLQSRPQLSPPLGIGDDVLQY